MNFNKNINQASGVKVPNSMVLCKHFFAYLIPVDTRRRYNVDTTSYDIVRSRINVETTPCVYGI